MAYRSIEELLDEVYAEATKKTYVKSLSVKVEGPILKCRIHLNDTFVNVFFNEDTGTIAFTLLRGDRRIFSARAIIEARIAENIINCLFSSLLFSFEVLSFFLFISKSSGQNRASDEAHCYAKDCKEHGVAD